MPLEQHRCEPCKSTYTRTFFFNNYSVGPPYPGMWNHWITGMTVCTQLCPTLCDLMNCILPGSSIHRIFQTKILKQITISFSRGSSQPRTRTHVSFISYNGRQFLYQLSHQGRSPRDDSTTSFYIRDLIIRAFGILGEWGILEWISCGFEG